VAYFRLKPRRPCLLTSNRCWTPRAKKLPFGIAQIGKAFRNEITPGNFISARAEFEQMEIEYFIEGGDWKKKF